MSKSVEGSHQVPGTDPRMGVKCPVYFWALVPCRSRRPARFLGYDRQWRIFRSPSRLVDGVFKRLRADRPAGCHGAPVVFQAESLTTVLAGRTRDID